MFCGYFCFSRIEINFQSETPCVYRGFQTCGAEPCANLEGGNAVLYAYIPAVNVGVTFC